MDRLAKPLKLLIIFNLILIDLGIAYLYRDTIFAKVEIFGKNDILATANLDIQINETNVDDFSIAYINLTSDGKALWATDRPNIKVMQWTYRQYGIKENSNNIIINISNQNKIRKQLFDYYGSHGLYAKMAFIDWLDSLTINRKRSSRGNIIERSNYLICAWDSRVLSKVYEKDIYTFAQTECSILVVLVGEHVIVEHYNRRDYSGYTPYFDLIKEIKGIPTGSNEKEKIEIYIISNYTPFINQYCLKVAKHFLLEGRKAEVFLHQKDPDSTYGVKYDCKRRGLFFFSNSSSLREVFPTGAYAYPFGQNPFSKINFRKLEF